MPKAKNKASKKQEKRQKETLAATATARIGSWFSRILEPLKSIWLWMKSLQPRTPHQSFRRTLRCDYVRQSDIPGHIAFTLEVFNIMRKHKTVFVQLTLVYAFLSAVVLGLASQSTYTEVGELLRGIGSEISQGNFGKITEAGVLLITAISGGISPTLSESQQLLGGVFVLMTWLTTVWLLRAFLAGQKPKLKDGFYNSGAPILPTFLLFMFMIIQMIPAAIAAIGISSIMPTGLINQGVEAMLFWIVALLLSLLTLYWITGTSIALVVVTLPGMYPLHALKSANELVEGRRLSIVFRLIWLLFISLLIWAIVLFPIILFDAWLKGVLPVIEWLPIVPISLLLVSAFSVVWTASYIYLLYRKVVDDNASLA